MKKPDFLFWQYGPWVGVCRAERLRECLEWHVELNTDCAACESSGKKVFMCEE